MVKTYYQIRGTIVVITFLKDKFSRLRKVSYKQYDKNRNIQGRQSDGDLDRASTEE